METSETSDQNRHHDQVEVPSPPHAEIDDIQEATQTRLEKRERLQRDRRMQRILTASQHLFSTHAYDEIAIEDIAAAAGMSKGLLYHYFTSKRNLYVATVAHVLHQMAH